MDPLNSMELPGIFPSHADELNCAITSEESVEPLRLFAYLNHVIEGILGDMKRLARMIANGWKFRFLLNDNAIQTIGFNDFMNSMREKMDAIGGDYKALSTFHFHSIVVHGTCYM